jgi:hypothetical protein
MMMGIGTPRSQSRIPRPMGLSFQPTCPRCPVLRVEFARLRGSGQPLRIESTPRPCRTDLPAATVAGAFVGGEGVEQLSERLPEASTVRLAAVRKRALSLAKASSIGFKSGL